MVTADCPSRQTLAEYAIGRLPDEQSDELAGHLDSCPDCQATILSLEDAEDTFIGRLRTPPASDAFLAEPQFQAAVAEAVAMQAAPDAASVRGSDSHDPLPQTIGEYQVLEELGHGGMGRVYKALHTKLGRVVALKVLTRGRGKDPQAIGRFEREMQAVGRLDHPNIVQAYDAREIDGTPVLVMELVDGLDFAEIVRRIGPLPVAEACELLRRTAAALQCGHEHGLVHRDIKPSNVMLTRSGEVKLLDLGLARFYADAAVAEFVVPPSGRGKPAEAGTTNRSAVIEEITGSGLAMGTADYMAPEQASDSRSVDIRADLYSLGCTLYKLLSGRAPFSGPDYRGTLDKLNAHVREPAPPIRQLAPEVPDKLAAILDRLLAKDPADRFATPAEVAAALEPFSSGADLAGVIQKALAADPLVLQHKAAADGSVACQSPSPATCRRPILTSLLIALALLAAMSASFAAGIWITIKRNNETYQVDAPPGSHTAIDEKGNVIVDMTGKPRQGGEEGIRSIRGTISLAEGIRVFNARAADDPVGKDQPPLAEEEVIAAVRWGLLEPDKLPVSDKTLETLRKIVDSRELPPGFELEVLTGFEPTDRMGFTKWSVRLRIPAEPTGSTCISIREVMLASRLFGEEERKVIDKWRKKWREQGGISSFQYAEYEKERAKAAEIDRARTESQKQPGEPAEPAPAVDPTADFQALQGPWKVVHAETTETMEYHRRIERMDFRGGSLRMTYAKSPAKEFFNYRIDPTARPRQIELFFSAGYVDESPSYFGIYDLDGDRLKISLVWNNPAVAGIERPKDFDLNSADIVWELDRFRPAEDETTLQGRWPVVSQTVDGKTIPDKKLRNKAFHFSGNSFNADLAYDELDVTLDLSGTYVLDQTETPGAVTFFARSDPPDVPAWEAELPGIYKLDGGRLTIAYRKGGPRPEEFESTPGSGVTLLVLERERPLIGAESEVPRSVDVRKPAAADVRYVGRFTQGTVELVGVTYDRLPSQTWWTPDGKVIDVGPFQPERPFSRISENEQARVYLFRFQDLPADASMPAWKLEPPGSFEGNYRVLGGDGKIAPEYKMLRPRTGSVQRANIQVGIGTGQWETVATWKPGSDGTINFRREGEDFSIEYEHATAIRTGEFAPIILADEQPIAESTDDSTRISLRHTVQHAWNVRLVAIGNDGSENQQELLHAEGKAIYDFRGLPLSSVKEFQFQVRPYDWAEFRNVELNPQFAPGPLVESPELSEAKLPAVDPTADLKALEGEWIVTAAMERSPGAKVAGIDVLTHLIFGEKSLHICDVEEGRVQEWGYRIDPRVAPKTIDLLRFRNGRFEDSGTLGVYEIADGRLTIGLIQSPSTLTPHRPKSLTIGPDSAEVLLTLVRYRPVADERAIEGDWGIVEFTRDGKPVPAEAPGDTPVKPGQRPHSYYSRDRYIRFEDHRIHFMNYDYGDELARSFHTKSGYYVLNSASTPKAITITASPLLRAPGIYAFEGERLRIAYREPDPFGRYDQSRPEKFASTPGSRVTLLVLENKAPTTAARTAPPRPDSAAPPAARPPQARAVNPAAELGALEGEWKVVGVEKGTSGDEAWAAICEFPLKLDPATTSRFAFGGVGHVSLLIRRRASTPEFRSLNNYGFLPPWHDQDFDYRINPTAEPKTIDLLNSLAGHASDTPRLAAQGIYEIEGDRMKICLRNILPRVTGGQRPEAFSVDPDSGDVLFLLERYRPSEAEKQLQGTWIVESEIVDGEPVSEDENTPRLCTFHEDYASIPSRERGGPCPFVLDAAEDPKRITFFEHASFEDGRRKSNDLHGIYQLDGDRLTIAWCGGEMRPKRFESRPGTGVTLLVLKRSQPPAPDADSKSGEGIQRRRIR